VSPRITACGTPREAAPCGTSVPRCLEQKRESRLRTGFTLMRKWMTFRNRGERTKSTTDKELDGYRLGAREGRWFSPESISEDVNWTYELWSRTGNWLTGRREYEENLHRPLQPRRVLVHGCSGRDVKLPGFQAGGFLVFDSRTHWPRCWRSSPRNIRRLFANGNDRSTRRSCIQPAGSAGDLLSAEGQSLTAHDHRQWQLRFALARFQRLQQARKEVLRVERQLIVWVKHSELTPQARQVVA